MIMMESGSQETLDSEITNLYSVQRRVHIRVIRVFTDSSTKDNTVTGRELPVYRVHSSSMLLPKQLVLFYSHQLAALSERLLNLNPDHKTVVQLGYTHEPDSMVSMSAPSDDSSVSLLHLYRLALPRRTCPMVVALAQSRSTSFSSARALAQAQRLLCETLGLTLQETLSASELHFARCS
ncbi:hypothetical protein BD769DRAFT_1382070 [Suillus cothurnatus]|nr:hypothetical protein BD769DRAFT_1382070 [Suillus cothurnatus]